MKIVPETDGREQLAVSLDEILRVGARQMLAAALEAEVHLYVDAAYGERDDNVHALVVRNGRARTRQVTTGAGAIEVAAPRVNDCRIDEAGERCGSASGTGATARAVGSW